MTAVWVGIDAGKWAHHCVVIDTTGRLLLSRRVANDEAALLELIAAVLATVGLTRFDGQGRCVDLI